MGNHFPSLPILIHLKVKPLPLNGLSIFMSKILPLRPYFFSLVVGVSTKSICFSCTLIDSVWCGYLNLFQNNPLPFQVFYTASDLIHCWGTVACGWTFLPQVRHQVVQWICHTQIYHSSLKLVWGIFQVCIYYQTPSNIYPFKISALPPSACILQ